MSGSYGRHFQKGVKSYKVLNPLMNGRLTVVLVLLDTCEQAGKNFEIPARYQLRIATRQSLLTMTGNSDFQQ